MAGRSVRGDVGRVPVATYRLQFRNGMTFDRAAGLIPHWRTLGISHLYASPIFSAVSGSTHGYDVTDPNRIDPDLGGIEGFRRLSDALRANGLGLILDIVPNHMAASLENPYWRDVLKWGRRSRYADFFDNDWNQALTLPILDEPLEGVVAAGRGKVGRLRESGEMVFDYCGSHYPIDPSTYPQSPLSEPEHVLDLLDRQPWRMIHWREAPRGLSYRRFFEVTGLVGVRVEDPSVFAETHRLILDLVAEGRVQGLRVDHIDGLADPAAYLRRLRDAVGPDIYLVVEKILEDDEQLPADWPVEGTTGYEFIADLAGLLTVASPELDDAWQRAAPEFGEPNRELARAKRLMVDVNFEGEVSALIRRAQSLAEGMDRRDLSGEMLSEAVRMLVAGFDIYRTYGTDEGLGEQDRNALETTVAGLSQSAPQLAPAFAFLSDVLFTRVDAAMRDAAVTFRTRLQHLTGPVLAKAVEDTFFYRYNRQIGVNEVGGDPMARRGGVEHFHRRMQLRRTSQPHGLTATATHDTKRGEDARARLYAISEAPAEWIALATCWRQELSHHVVELADGRAPESAVEWLIFQGLAGMLPPDFDPSDDAARHDIRHRFLAYLEKALREAKLRTNWSDVNEAYEKAVKDYAAAAIDSGTFIDRFWRDIQPFVATGFVNSLTQTLIKLTAPGVPDIYQGTESADMSLVDPDNRRMPDYERLTSAIGGAGTASFELEKSRLLRTALALRKDHPELFALGDYVRLLSTGPRSANVIAYARRHGGLMAVSVAPRLVHEAVAARTLLSPAYWEDTSIHLPDGARLLKTPDALNQQEPDGSPRIARLFQTRPWALLMAEG